MGEYIQVTTTIDSREGAQRIAERLLEEKLAACVQISGPITSSYWWKGERESAREWSCTAKSTAARYPQIERAIREVHGYEEPEILATAVVFGSDGYLRWIRDTVQGGNGESQGVPREEPGS